MAVRASAAAAVLDAVRAIPPGETRGYGEVARAAGFPRGARLAARALAESSDPDLPWHRVLRADGRIALPPGSPGFDEQVARLRAEGIAVVDGRVRVKRARRAGLDALLWASPAPAIIR